MLWMYDSRLLAAYVHHVIKPVLIYDPVLERHQANFANCYSANLHLLDNEYPETQDVVPSGGRTPSTCTVSYELHRLRSSVGKNNKTGPRSQEMCRAFCRLIYLSECQDCDLNQRVYTESMKLCPYSMDYPNSCVEKLRNDIDECKLNCKPECLKLKYKYAKKQITQNHFLQKLTMGDSD
ncbi:hypothetical protein CEXT_335401 [Caerostris extrusa]|uniref:Uncharacterized protein n=1 Tax=Caerostris extrusa TaxID=172846 RepID=A0AAV4XKU5_CAEEX|nr:hypothetical protein CEXT_335401 [Caerostris extrusa]